MKELCVTLQQQQKQHLQALNLVTQNIYALDYVMITFYREDCHKIVF